MSWFKRRKKGSAEDKAETQVQAQAQDSPVEETEDLPEPQEETPAEPEEVEEVSPSASETETETEQAVPPEEPPKKRNGLVGRFRERLFKTRSALGSRLEGLFAGKAAVDEDLLEELEEVLITADLGVEASMRLLESLRKSIKRKNLTEASQLRDELKEALLQLLEIEPPESAWPGEGPEVILVVGVNGVGKTTTIGKLAHLHIQQGRSVLLAAGDTFRAAAAEQLTVWADRVGASIVKHGSGADPSAVAFDALEAALARGIDVVIVDTAGRLHTKVNLMEELKKVRRVMAKKIPTAPHQTLLVLDATTGQNALAQAKIFDEATPLSGLVLTKLDGTAKGGIVAAVAHQIQKPVCYVGLGEQMDDLKPFDPEVFVEAIL